MFAQKPKLTLGRDNGYNKKVMRLYRQALLNEKTSKLLSWGLNINSYPEKGGQRQGKTWRNREFQSPVFESGRMDFFMKNQGNQGIS